MLIHLHFLKFEQMPLRSRSCHCSAPISWFSTAALHSSFTQSPCSGFVSPRLKYIDPYCSHSYHSQNLSIVLLPRNSPLHLWAQVTLHCTPFWLHLKILRNARLSILPYTSDSFTLLVICSSVVQTTSEPFDTLTWVFPITHLFFDTNLAPQLLIPHSYHNCLLTHSP